MAKRRLVDILVIDDDQVFRDRLTLSLEKRGYSVEKASSVNDATQKLLSIEPQRVILDLKMPGRSGLEMITVLKESCPQVEIIILTGYGSISTTQEALKRGASYYLTKPCSTQRIIEVFEGAQSFNASLNLPIPSLAQVEWDHINRIISDCGGNITKAAEVLGINRRSLQRRLAKSPRFDQ